MKGIAVSMQIECDCGNLLHVNEDTDLQLPMIKQEHYKCSVCKSSYFLHIQEIKQSTCKIPPVIV